MPVNICSLSSKLTARSAEYLESDDLFSLRLANRYLRDSSLCIFTRRYFQVRIHLATLRGLNCLLDISQHPLFGRALRVLVISERGISDEFIDEEPAVAEHFAECDFIRESGLVAAYLTQVLRNAVDCRTIALDNFSDRPWGKAALQREAGQRLMVTRYSTNDHPRLRHHDSGAHVLRSIVVAMMTSGAPIASVDLSQMSAKVAASNVFQLPKPSYCDSQLTKSRWFNTLTALHVSLYIDVLSFSHVSGMTEFIRRLARLQSLFLNFRYRGQPAVTRVRARLAKLYQLSSNLHAPRLRTLKIERLNCLAEHLITIADAHRDTLKDITFDHVLIYVRSGESWRTLLTAVRDKLRIAKLRMDRCFVEYDGGAERAILYHDGGGDSSYRVELAANNNPEVLSRLINGLREEDPRKYSSDRDRLMSWK